MFNLLFFTLIIVPYLHLFTNIYPNSYKANPMPKPAVFQFQYFSNKLNTAQTGSEELNSSSKQPIPSLPVGIYIYPCRVTALLHLSLGGDDLSFNSETALFPYSEIKDFRMGTSN